MNKKNAGIIIVFTILAVIMTFPLAFKMNTHIPGFTYTDEPYAGIWDSWRVRYSIFHHISVSHTPFIAYPFGADMYAGYFAFLWMGLMYLLSIISTPIVMFNIQVLVNFILRGVFIYYLVFHMTKNRSGAVFSGLAFTFCPYQFVRSWQHLGLTYTQWIPLCLYAAILLREKSSIKRMVFFLLSVLLLFSFDYSVTYFGLVTLASFLIYLILLYNWKNKLFRQRSLIFADFKYLKAVFAIGIAAFIILLPQLFPIIRNSLCPTLNSAASGFNPYHRPFNDLFTQSAKPLSYLLPAVVHPLFGKFTEQWIGSPLYGVSYTEHTLYLGWTTLILAFVAFRRWRRSRKDHQAIRSSGHQLDESEKFYIGFFVWLAIAAWAFSQPPYFTFPYFKIYMPSFFMYKILPMFRAYCRFGIVVMLAVSVLAGFGLKCILERFKSNKIKIAFTSLVCGLVLFEFLNFPPFKVIDLTKYPKVYDWLKKEKGDFVIAEYPLDADSPNEYYKFCQTIHEKKIINGTIPGTYANKVAKTIWKLSEPRTVGILSWMKVKYVLVHLDAYEKSNDITFVNEFERIKRRDLSGLRFIKSFDSVDVYEVIASPEAPGINE